MTDSVKILGQSAPLATTLTDIYTVPAATQSTISSIVVANTSSTATTFRLSVAIAGAADTIAQYLHRDIAINGNDSFAFTGGITLAAGDVLRGYAGAATLSFNVFGVETT